MADDRRRPLQTPEERALASDPRRKTAPRGIPAVPVAIEFDGDTGVVEGVELEERRAKRPTPLRIAHLEKRTDKHGDQIADLVTTVANVRSDLGEVIGQLKELPKTVDRLARAVEGLTAERTAEAHALKADGLHAKQQWRERLTKAVGWIFSGGVLVEILHRLGVL